MRTWLLALTFLSCLLVPATQAEDPLPFPDGEHLKYTISYPSGLDLGEADFRAEKLAAEGGQPERWQFDFNLTAAIPAFEVKDQIHSVATAELCSILLRKEISHGSRRAEERTRFDQEAGRATRETLNDGGQSEIDTPACATDALTFVYHLRSELGRGRVPPPRKVFFGAAYDVSFQTGPTQKVTLGGEQIDADQLIVTTSGPASQSMFILLVARDAARTPVRITVPLEPGNFTMELIEE
jgi:hypothetical protein